MSKVEDREDRPTVTSKDEQAILEAASKINLGKLLEDDYIDIEVPVIPGHLTVTYRSPFGEEVFEVEEELESLENQSEISRYNYSIFRSLATSVMKLNGKRVPETESIIDKIEFLKRKPKHVIDQILWGHVTMSEALRRLVEDPEKIEEQIKNSLGTP